MSVSRTMRKLEKIGLGEIFRKLTCKLKLSFLCTYSNLTS